MGKRGREENKKDVLIFSTRLRRSVQPSNKQNDHLLQLCFGSKSTHDQNQHIWDK